MSPAVDQGLIARTSDKTFYVFNAIVSTAALAFLAWLLLLRDGSSELGDLSYLPAVNAVRARLAR